MNQRKLDSPLPTPRGIKKIVHGFYLVLIWGVKGAVSVV